MPDLSSRPHLLILGGTGEAAALARGVSFRFGDAVALTTALAGRTLHPGPIDNEFQLNIEHGISRLVGRDATAMLNEAIPLHRVNAVVVNRVVPNPAGSISPDDRSHSELRPTSTWTTRSRGRYAASNVSGRAGHRLKQAILSQGRAGTFANLRRYAGVLRKV